MQPVEGQQPPQQPAPQYQQPYPQYPPPYQPQYYPPPPPQPKGTSTAGKVVAVVVVIVVLVIAIIVLANFFRTSPASPTATPNVNVTNLGATASCPLFSQASVTFSFNLVNSGSANAYATVDFYEQGSMVGSNQYYAAAGSNTPYTMQVPVSSCPPNGFSFNIAVGTVTPA